MVDRALAAAERAGLVNVAAEALAHKGVIAMYQGRLWEAHALLDGGRRLAEENNLPEVAMRSMNMLAATVAHDDPAEALRMERSAIELARQLGRRSAETVTLGNAAEDARRTGDWGWAISELQAVLENDLDDSTRLTLRAALALLLTLQGRLSREEFDDILSGIERLADVDTTATSFDMQANEALVRGDFRTTYDYQMRVVGISDLNAPYCLPRAGHAAVLAGDAAGAEAALTGLDDLGVRGRAVDADRAAIRAGIAAIAGDAGSAVTGYRTAIEAFQSLGLVWDEALAGLSAVIRLGPDNPAARDWARASRAIFTRLEAARLLALLDDAEGPATGEDATAGRDGRGASVQELASRN